MEEHADRRRFRRTRVDHTGKVYLRRALKYLPVRALDVSLGGILVEIRSDRPLHPGDAMDVVVTERPTAVVGPADTITARVAHITRRRDGTQQVGLAFDHEHAVLAEAA